MAELVGNPGKDIRVSVIVEPRSFAVRDESGAKVEGALGSVGYGAYEPVVIDGLRHQLSLNIVVNKSKGWNTGDKKAWLELHKDAVQLEVSGYADEFKKAGNTGWRVNSQVLVGGEKCTASGSLVLSAKTVKASGDKAAKAAQAAADKEAAYKAHEAAKKAARLGAAAAMKASVAK